MTKSIAKEVVAMLGLITTGSDDEEDFQDAKQGDTDTDKDNDTDTLLANLAQRKSVHPADMHHIMSSSMAKKPSPPKSAPSNSNTHQANVHEITYSVSRHECVAKNMGALTNRGANGGVAGEDCHVISYTRAKVHVQGVDNHQVPDVPIAHWWQAQVPPWSHHWSVQSICLYRQRTYNCVCRSTGAFWIRC